MSEYVSWPVLIVCGNRDTARYAQPSSTTQGILDAFLSNVSGFKECFCSHFNSTAVRGQDSHGSCFESFPNLPVGTATSAFFFRKFFNNGDTRWFQSSLSCVQQLCRPLRWYRSNRQIR